MTKTNKHANQKVHERRLSQRLQLRSWLETDVAKVYCFLAVVLLMSLVRKNTQNTNPWIPCLKLLFSSQSFLPTAFAFWCLMRPIMEAIRERFSTLFALFQDLCIMGHWCLGKDDFLSDIVHFLGGTDLASRCLCCVMSATASSCCTLEPLQVTILKEFGFTGSVVVADSSFVADFLGKGHFLFVDNWYTSSALFDYLRSRQTNACGAVHTNRKGLLKLAEKLRQGEVERSYMNTMLALKWRDRQNIHMLSTMHGARWNKKWIGGQVKRRSQCAW